MVLLSSHVSPPEALNSDSCRTLMLVEFPFRPHSHIALNDNSCSGLQQKLGITDRKKHFRNTSKIFIKFLNQTSALVWHPHLPACLVTPYMFLNSNGRLPHPQVLFTCQPAANSLLDGDTSHTQFVRAQLLQESHLASSEEDLVFAKLVFPLVLKQNLKNTVQYVLHHIKVSL